MSRVIGIELRDGSVRAVVLRAAYRKFEFEASGEERLADHETREDAIRACVTRVGGFEGHRIDTVATSLEGEKSFVHQLSLPASAEKRLSELLPFELEAQLPVDIDDVVYSHEVLPRSRGAKHALEVLTVSARTDHVRAKIDALTEAARGPDRVGASGIDLGQLAQLCPALRLSEVVILNMGHNFTDLCVLKDGIVRGARTLGLGVNAFPAKAQSVAAQLRQTLSGFLTVLGTPVTHIYVCGEGLALAGLLDFLGSELGIAAAPLPALSLEGSTGVARAELGRYAAALSSALHGARGKGFDLRQGPLSFQRGYSYLKERAPLLLGMAAAVVISFLFSTWAEGRALESEQVRLSAELLEVTKVALGEATDDPDEAQELLLQAQKNKPEDPMPYLDGFGAAVALAETLPADIKHDAEQLEYTKGKLKLRGVVDSTDQVQRVAKALDEHRCIENATVTKISQVVNSQRERYMLEADVRCPEDPPDPKKKAEQAKAAAEKAAAQAPAEAP